MRPLVTPQWINNLTVATAPNVRHSSDEEGETAEPPAKIRVRNLEFFYGESRALTQINLPFYDKRVTALIGPSGCGKSTLLRVFNRIYELYPDQRATGEVLLDGQNIS